MVNPFIYVGVKIDNAIMKGVDYLIKGYNWTTGGTKADLANSLLFALPVCFFAQGIKDLNLTDFIIGSLITLDNINVSKFNKEQVIREQDALEQDCKSADAELYKKISKGKAYVLDGLDVCSVATFGTEYWSLGAFPQGLSFHIISSDENPPKRNNCLKRAKKYLDNLKKEPSYVQKGNLEGLV